MANCPQCQGLLVDDPLEGEVKCSSCSRRYEKPKGRDRGAQGGALQITVTLEPKTLPELYTAIAQTKGMTTGTAYLQSLGLSTSEAKHMAQGRIVYPEAAVKVIEDLGITPTDFITLLKATAKATRGAAKPGRKPKAK